MRDVARGVPWAGELRALAIANVLVALLFLAAGCSGGSGGTPLVLPAATASSTQSPTPIPTPNPVAFVPNTFAFWDNPSNFTTGFGPAYANVLLTSTNFLPCLGGPFALCYYAGPAPQTCTLSTDGRFADCHCYAISFGQYFVDINAILNFDIYLKTITACGSDGSKCQTLNSAPICQAVNAGHLIPGADLISTFSFDCVPSDGLGQTNCATALYAGCMTSGCHGVDSAGMTTCQCPTFNGPYQVGQNDQKCSLGGDQVWSAAYAPPSTTTSSRKTIPAAESIARSVSGGTFPKPPGCVPDAPGGVACPLYVPGQTLPPDSGVNCAKVCSEYDSCINNDVQTGYTCDSTLCTRECNDNDLVNLACANLNTCELSEIIKAETAAQCSCCASQLCSCSADAATNAEIAHLNDLQVARGITPQCKINGTLCGSASP
jgi:hypothetical protein